MTTNNQQKKRSLTKTQYSLTKLKFQLDRKSLMIDRNQFIRSYQGPIYQTITTQNSKNISNKQNRSYSTSHLLKNSSKILPHQTYLNKPKKKYFNNPPKRSQNKNLIIQQQLLTDNVKKLLSSIKIKQQSNKLKLSSLEYNIHLQLKKEIKQNHNHQSIKKIQQILNYQIDFKRQNIAQFSLHKIQDLVNCVQQDQFLHRNQKKQQRFLGLQNNIDPVKKLKLNSKDREANNKSKYDSNLEIIQQVSYINKYPSEKSKEQQYLVNIKQQEKKKPQKIVSKPPPTLEKSLNLEQSSPQRVKQPINKKQQKVAIEIKNNESIINKIKKAKQTNLPKQPNIRKSSDQDYFDDLEEIKLVDNSKMHESQRVSKKEQDKPNNQQNIKMTRQKLKKQSAQSLKQIFINKKKQIQTIIPIGQVAGYCSQIMRKSKLNWYLPSLLLYYECYKCYKQMEPFYRQCLKQSIINKQQFDTFLMESNLIRGNLQKINKSAQKKNKINQNYKHFLLSDRLQTIDQIIYKQIINYCEEYFKSDEKDNNDTALCTLRMINAGNIILVNRGANIDILNNLDEMTPQQIKSILPKIFQKFKKSINK